MSSIRVKKGINDFSSWCLKNNNPILLKEWDYEKNVDLSPDSVTAHSSKRVWWKCNKCKFVWITAVSNRTLGRGCPCCAGKIVTKDNNLMALFPDFAKEWDYEKNEKNPTDILPKVAYRAWWKCSNGHSWQASVNNRVVHKSGCPICAKRIADTNDNLAIKYPELAQQWNNEKNNGSPTDYRIKSNKKVWWICPKGHEWQASIYSRTNGNGCPVCNMSATSFPEQAILFYMRKAFSKVLSRDRSAIGKELDIYIPEIKTGIEYDGAYWHARERTSKTESEKDLLCKKHGINLIRIIEAGVSTNHPKDIVCLYRKNNNVKDKIKM